MNLSDTNRKILLDYIIDILRKRASSISKEFLSKKFNDFPANDQEARDWSKLKSIEHIQPLLQRLLEMNATDVLLELFCLIDGAAHPENTDWTGVLLVDMPEDFDEYVVFLHDELLHHT